MNMSWLLLPSGLLALAGAWYGYSSYNDTPPPPGAGRPPPQKRSSPPCMCGLPPSLRMRTILSHVFPERPRVQHRMGGDDEVPDLSSFSTEELQELLGLPPDLIPTEEEIEDLQKLLNENQIPLSVVMQAGDMNIEVNSVEELDELAEADSEEESAAEEGEEEGEKEHGERKKEEKEKEKKKDKDKGSGSPFDVLFSPEVMDAADAVFEGSDIPVQTLSNPFPQRPFPADYDDYSSLYLGDGGYLSPNSYLHPVRTFKFRLFMPTFHQFFGFQFASQTIVELYVAKIPGPNQITGIPDAFYEKKYWNVLFEVDGNQVISTIPQQAPADQAAEPAESRVDTGGVHHRNTAQHMSHKSSIHAFNDATGHRRNFTSPSRNSMYSSSGTPTSQGGSWGHAPPNLPQSMKNGGAFHSHQPSNIQGGSVITRRRGQPAAPVRSTGVKPAALARRREMLRQRRRQRLQHEAQACLPTANDARQVHRMGTSDEKTQRLTHLRPRAGAVD